MPHAIRIHQCGGPETMLWEEVNVAPPAAGEVLVRNTAVGLNYVDTYHRRGLYPVTLPTVLGREGAGVVEAVGRRVKDLKVGDRVAYVQPIGAYAEVLIRPAQHLVKLPPDMDDRIAAAIMLKGMTAWTLCRQVFPVGRRDTILVHAAAGGVGHILAQWARHLGATVIGTVGSDEKAELAREAGCHHVIILAREDFVARVREITKGKMLPVVYDGVGRNTFMQSLDCLRPKGLMVNYGNASGEMSEFNPTALSRKGSLFLTRPSLLDYIAKRADLVKAAKELFGVVMSGAVKISINQSYPLRDAAQAHGDLEARKTTGATVLLP